jgi:hypothetical protein
MKRLYTLMALGLVAALALSGIAMAKDHGRHHGRHHHDRFIGQAGTVSSFDAATGKLTIALTNGESVTGLVTNATEIKCEGVDDRLQRRDHGSGDDNGGHFEPGDDNGGRGEPEPGDDHGGQNEPGDDNGGEAPASAPAPVEAGCGTASLVTGEIVSEAELRLEGGMAVFEEVELGLHH